MATRLEADLLIPGAGDPIPNGCVTFDGATISYAGPLEGAPRPMPGDTTIRAPTVMPGLWDCHTHFSGIRKISLEEQIYTPISVGLIRSVTEAEAALRAGFTSVRELAGHGVFLSRAVNEGTIPGPHIYASGTALSPTGGHADIHAFPIEFVRLWRNAQELPGPCDGIPDCLAAVRKVLRLGAEVVKVCASGGVLSDVDDPKHQQFSDAELAAMVEEAGRSERLVAAHCHGKAGIMAALKAGCGTIEHGTYLDDEAAELMAKRGALLSPTLTMKYELLPVAGKVGLPAPMVEKAGKIAGQISKGMQAALRHNVPIALGTDIGLTSPSEPAHWGGNGHEFAYMVREGMTPLEAIRSGTANGPLTLGARAPRSGQLREGYAADVIVVAENPLKRIEVLGEPERILRVWKDGRLAVDRTGTS